MPLPKLLPFLLFLLALIPLQAAPTAGELKQSLDGTWDFTIDPQLASQAGGTWDSITVPGNWDVLPAYAKYSGKGWYRRTFSVPADWKGKHLRLHFGAVNETAQVTLNGHDLGSHRGGYTPFEFDVTDAVTYGGENTLVVCADNTYHRGAWWPWGGISRSVDLLANDDVRLVWQHISAMPNLDDGTALISVKVKVANLTDAAKTVILSSTLAGISLPAVKTEVTLSPKSDQDTTFSFTLPKEAVKLWDFDHPNLYSLETTVTENGAVEYAQADRFGIRKVEAKPDGIYLNGEKVRLTGFNRVSDSNTTGNTEPDALVKHDVDLMKSAGANMARLMHTPHAPNLLDYLDEKGMLIFAEIPVWGGGDPQVKKDNPVTKQWLKEMIDRDYNHPCIIGWSPGNEIWGHDAYVKSMFAYIRSDLDSSRLLSYASNTATSEHPGPIVDPASACDLIMINSYGGFGKALERVHQRWPDKPIFFSEWGFHQIGAKLNAKLPTFDEGIQKTVQDHPYLVGFSIWTFNDYRSAMKDTPASGNREWGVVDVDRKPKAAYEQVRTAYSPVHELTVGPGTIRIVPRGADEVPSYAVRGYVLKWEDLDASGAVTKTGTIPVPDLKPGDAPWETPFAESGRVKVSLVTPTGMPSPMRPDPEALLKTPHNNSVSYSINSLGRVAVDLRVTVGGPAPGGRGLPAACRKRRGMIPKKNQCASSQFGPVPVSTTIGTRRLGSAWTIRSRTTSSTCSFSGR